MAIFQNFKTFDRYDSCQMLEYWYHFIDYDIYVFTIFKRTLGEFGEKNRLIQYRDRIDKTSENSRP